MYEYEGKNVILMACSACNINCKHCYISYKGNRTPKDLLAITKHLKKKYIVKINGAEVLTNINYLSSFQELNQSYIMSNGIAIYQAPKIIDKIKSFGIKSVSISYHFGIQNDISMMKQRSIDATIKIIQEKGIETRILTTITTDNYDKVDKMCEKARELGVKGIKFTNFLAQGNATELSSNLILNENQKQEFLNQIGEARKKYNKNDLIIERCGSFGEDSDESRNRFKCIAITDLLVITPDNNVYPCVFLAKPGFEIGKYENGKIMIYDQFAKNDGTYCLADMICNREKEMKGLIGGRK